MSLLEELKSLLQQDERLVSDVELLKNRIVELGLKHDKDLIKLLLSNTKIREHFFEEVEQSLIFNKEKFMKFVDNKEFLPDSYTAFKNKIGLTVDKKYLTKSREVVLSWPYKDCVLEGGQVKEEEKRREIFHNEVLAPDEIDRLLDPKVFTNFKRIDAKGEHRISEIKSTDNLIVKGNNLLVLHSLKEKYIEKIKLIYIDPPFNTGNDSFNYNDYYNHSTWLTFMKNRLEIAKELLSEDGAIFVHIDDSEQAYLKTLMDEIFERENFLNLITITSRSPSGFKTVNPGVYNSAEYLLIYAKNKKHLQFNDDWVECPPDRNYNSIIINIEDQPTNWKVRKIRDIIPLELGFKNAKEAKEKLGNDIFQNKIDKFAIENSERVFRLTEISDKGAGKETVEIKKISKTSPDKVFVVKREEYDDRYILDGREITFYSKKVREIHGEKVPTLMLSNVWTDISWEGIANEGDVKLKKGKKPERLLKRIIKIGSDENDLIMDFFLGSGTTAAVAHKMGRRYIGIEQLDYGKNSAIERLKNVIGKANSKGKLVELIEDYDTTGISKEVDWEGGGDFVYCELKEFNEQFIKQIKKAKNSTQLLEIWEEMKNHAFLSYKVDPKFFDDNIEGFQKLSLKEQKKLLIECLDHNNLYLNYSEIEDDQYKVSEDEIELNRKFYGGL
ncbi:MAG: site-specific DNA-methyltransferase [Candidatus Heimdallarchaeota archaeon]|nr:site-specific DNA-methyltransferase [Candidatus Heimdallarchaeota archaeon]